MISEHPKEKGPAIILALISAFMFFGTRRLQNSLCVQNAALPKKTGSLMSKMSLTKQSLVFQVGPPYSCTDSLSLSSEVQTECH